MNNKGIRCTLMGMVCVVVLMLSGCDDDKSAANNDGGISIVIEHADNGIQVENTIKDNNLADENDLSLEDGVEDESIDDSDEATDDEETTEEETVEEGEAFNPDEATSYLDKTACEVDKASNLVKYSMTFKGDIPASDDGEIYLFDIDSYENEDSISNKEALAHKKKSKEMTFEIEYKTRYLFSQFVPTILYEGKYVPLAKGLYISNPGSLAVNNKAYPKIGSKKGILIDGTTIGDDRFSSLNVKRIVYNIPLSLIVGDTTDPSIPTVNYEYNGTTYHFNGYYVMVYDSFFATLTNQGCYCTAIILNDWNSKYTEMMHPKARNKTSKSLYYAFNTEEEDGARLLEATALFLAERYSSGNHGMVYDWVIANEVNQHKIWNYMETDDLGYYTRSFEKSFRTFYNAIKSTYSNAKISFSIDHDWNDNGGNNSKFFNGRDLMYKFNEVAKAHGNYDWGLAIHPYPDPLPKVDFWKGEFDKSETAKVMTPMNLSCLTKMMTKDEFRDTSGKVRDIAITELGFSSSQGEQLQAAAFAYCYLIVENNEYINSFLMNRQTDSAEEMQTGMALGAYTINQTPKYMRDIFGKIDTGEKDAYIPEMLEIIGAGSLEEALSWAK